MIDDKYIVSWLSGQVADQYHRPEEHGIHELLIILHVLKAVMHALQSSVLSVYCLPIVMSIIEQLFKVCNANMVIVLF